MLIENSVQIHLTSMYGHLCRLISSNKLNDFEVTNIYILLIKYRCCFVWISGDIWLPIYRPRTGWYFIRQEQLQIFCFGGNYDNTSQNSLFFKRNILRISCLYLNLRVVWWICIPFFVFCYKLAILFICYCHYVLIVVQQHRLRMPLFLFERTENRRITRVKGHLG